jgi:hypothetical protein
MFQNKNKWKLKKISINLSKGKEKEPSSNYKQLKRIPISTDFKHDYLDNGAQISYLSIEFEPTQDDIGFMRVKLYPTRINLKEAIQKLELILFPMSESVSKILLNAKITELDLALDIKGIHINELLFKAKKMKFQEVITTDSKTIYLGNRKCSDNCFCIYDKGFKVKKLAWNAERFAKI